MQTHTRKHILGNWRQRHSVKVDRCPLPLTDWVKLRFYVPPTQNRSQLVDHENSRPVGDLSWLGSVLWVLLWHYWNSIQPVSLYKAMPSVSKVLCCNNWRRKMKGLRAALYAHLYCWIWPMNVVNHCQCRNEVKQQLMKAWKQQQQQQSEKPNKLLTNHILTHSSKEHNWR